MSLLSPIYAQDKSRPAVIVGGGAISYGRFCSDIDVMARWLFEQRGIVRENVLIYHPRSQSYWSWVLHLAAIHLGAKVASAFAASGIRAVLQSGAVRQVISLAPRDIRLPEGIRTLRVPLEGGAPLEQQLACRISDVAPLDQHAGRIATTTGTTGRPKNVVWDCDTMLGRVQQVEAGGMISPATRSHVVLGIGTTGGFRYPLATWRAGGVVVFSGKSANGGGRNAGEECSLLVASPAQLRQAIAEHPGVWQGRDSREVILLGGRLPPALRDAAYERVCSRVVVGYGSTETGSVVSGDAKLVDRHPGAVGYALPGVTVEIVDEQDRPLETGRTGIVRIRSPLMVAGYEQAQAPDGSSFRNGWFYPGDLAVLAKDGMLAIEGRVAETINIGGSKIAAPSVEEKLAGIEGVEELCALGLNLDDRDLLTVAVVCDDDVDLRVVHQAVRAKLPPHWTFHLAKVPAIERNAMGKVARRVMAAKLSAAYRKKLESRNNAH